MLKQAGAHGLLLAIELFRGLFLGLEPRLVPHLLSACASASSSASPASCISSHLACSMAFFSASSRGLFLVRFPLGLGSLLCAPFPERVRNTEAETHSALSRIGEVGAKKVDLKATYPMGREPIVGSAAKHP